MDLKLKLRNVSVRLWNWHYEKREPFIPVSPVVKGINSSIINGTKDDISLPAIRINDPNGILITKWKIDFWQRVIMLFTGSLYIHYRTFYKPVQGLKLTTWRPDLEDPDFNKKISVTKQIDVEINKQWVATRNFMNEYMNKRYNELMHGKETHINSGSPIDRIQ